MIELQGSDGPVIWGDQQCGNRCGEHIGQIWQQVLRFQDGDLPRAVEPRCFLADESPKKSRQLRWKMEMDFYTECAHFWRSLALSFWLIKLEVA